MKLENQVCSLELAKELKKLGVTQESVWYWGCPKWNIEQNNAMLYNYSHYTNTKDIEMYPNYYSAFTVAELGEMLPDEFFTLKNNQPGGWAVMKDNEIQFKSLDLTYKDCLIRADTEANARAKMLIYLLKNNLITNE